MTPELELVLLELELVVDAFVDEGLEVTGTAAELVDAFVEEELEVTGTAAELVDTFAEEVALDGVVDGVVEAGAVVEPEEEPGAARAGTAAPARTRR